MYINTPTKPWTSFQNIPLDTRLVHSLPCILLIEWLPTFRQNLLQSYWSNSHYDSNTKHFCGGTYSVLVNLRLLFFYVFSNLEYGKDGGDPGVVESSNSRGGSYMSPVQRTANSTVQGIIRCVWVAFFSVLSSLVFFFAQCE